MKKPEKSSSKYEDWHPTDEEFAAFQPISEVDPELLAAYKGGTLKKRGRPKLLHPKKLVSVRLDADILTAYKTIGKGWQAQLNSVLRQHMPH